MTKGTTFYAHSSPSPDESEWQTLKDHLTAVGNLAADKASHFGTGEVAKIAGQLHDLGKYCDEFQARLRGSNSKVDHATWGARIAIERFQLLGKLLAYGIAGHHAGLADGRESSQQQKITPLEIRLARKPETELNPIWQQEIDLGNPALPSLTPAQGQEHFQFSLLGRMLYSCLVDADFLDTEAFYNHIEGATPRDDNFPSLRALREELNRYLSQPEFRSAEGINKIRGEILNRVRSQANEHPGLFSLNVPTGGGKTLTSLTFALDHAIAHGLRRVILVIPFTSIVEQNAAVFRRALGPLGEHAVLEHHSTFSDEGLSFKEPRTKDKLREAEENWEAPIIVTTAVQFFESLFANRSSRCRKLHNIANSVVILDEAQTLPYKLLRPCVATIAELARNYQTSLVLCTATQPALSADDGFEHGLTAVRELAPEPQKLHQKLERTTVRHIGAVNDEELTERLISHHQALCIVNNRRHAYSLFEQIRNKEGCFHLSTLMCAQHRSDKLKEIRGRLKQDQPCIVISTSLIEAGVDVDFPLVYRAEAGLDSIAQAAGRCNREGKHSKEDSLVNVFAVADDWPPPPELEQYAQASQTIFRKHGESPLSLDAIRDYFQEVYWVKGPQLDAYSLMQQIENGGIGGIPYEQLARQFRMIESNMTPIIVPYVCPDEDKDESQITKLLNELYHSNYVGQVSRKLQRYLVQVPHYALVALQVAEAVQPIRPELFGDQFLELVSTDLYDRDNGLSWDNPEFISAENAVM